MRCKTCNKKYPKNYFITTTLMGDLRTKSMECLYCSEERQIRNNAEGQLRYRELVDKWGTYPSLERIHVSAMKSSEEFLKKLNEMKKKLEEDKI